MSRKIRNNSENQNDVKGQCCFSTALYIRLSREDGDKEESDSVNNQRDMLLSFILSDVSFKLFDIYIDDGYTGTNFNRPDFKRMINDMKSKLINCIIVKDLSRFGRDYIGVGDYQENIFPRYDVRFVAVNDHIDTLFDQDGLDSIIIPFKNIINEQYARDISHKVRSALDTKRRRGEFIGSFACFGYQKDSYNKNHLIIDEEAAQTVRLMFKWFICGVPKLTIANRLNDLKILCPSEYKKQKGEKYVNPNRLEKTCYFTHTTIHRALSNEMYIGNMVQHKETVKNFKQKKNIQLDRQEWIIVLGTHEAIIDKDTWEIAQRLLKADVKKSRYTGEIHLFAGLIKCGDCGRAMKKRVNGKNTYYICGTYMMYGKNICTNHSIKAEVLYGMVRDEISVQIKNNVDFEKIKFQIIEKVRSEKSSKIIENKMNSIQKQLENLNVLRRGLYEDFKKEILEKNEYFFLKKNYEGQIVKLQSTIWELESKQIKQNDDKTIKSLDELILKYKEKSELTRELLVSLVKQVIIYQNNKIDIDFAFETL